MFHVAVMFGAVAASPPWDKRVTQLAAESPDDAPSPELAAALHDPRMRVVDWFDRLIILAFLFDMVVKLFS